MCSLCRLPVANNHNFGQILTSGDSCTEHRLLMRVKFCVLEETQGIHLHMKFHVNVFFVLASAAQNHNFGQILTIVDSCTDTLLAMRSKFSAACARADPWCTLRAKFRLHRFILSPSCSDKTQFFRFFGLRHFVVSPITGNLIKLNTGAQLQTKASKSFKLTPSWRNRAHKL